jgi:hypothetical protein
MGRGSPVLATAEDVVRFALSFEGYRESPAGSNNTKFGKAFGMDGVPWCAMFTWYCLQHFKVEIIKSAYTPTIAQWFKDEKRGFADDSDIQRGDLVFFDFPDSVSRIQHIGYALGPLKDGGVPTIEGNTSSGDSGSQDNGGGVFKRVRSPRDIVYIGRPRYAADKPPRFDLPKQRTWLRKGDKGADVRTLQRDLNRWMRCVRKTTPKDKLDFDFGVISTEGEFGPETKKALQTFQMQYPRLEPDGLFGRETERVLDAVRERQTKAGCR